MTSPNTTPPSARLPPDSSPTPTSSLTSPIPNAPAPNGIDGRYSTAGIPIAAARAAHEILTDQRVQPAQGVDEGDRDDRQRQLVGQHPLVEVRREADDERHEPGAEQRRSRAGRPEAQRQEPERDGADQRRDTPSASPRDGPAGCSSSCSGQRVANRSAAIPSANPATPSSTARTSRSPISSSPIVTRRAPVCGARLAVRVRQSLLAPASASSTSVACETPVAPRGANGRALR